jgi:tRNA-splicing ligase RtcB (3'-phosphate/5'-hydroxy nucleic acid ligase)
MVEHAGDYEWRGEGEGAEVVVYAPGEELAEAAFGRIAPITRLPGVESPVHAAASRERFGWVAASASHAAPDLVSIPERGLLLAADVPAEDLGMPPRGIEDLVLRDLGEAGYRPPPLNEAGVRRACEEGARAAAEDGLIEEEDLSFLEPVAGDSDAVGRRAIAAGPHEQERIGLRVAVVAEVLDADGAEALGLERGMLALVVRAGAGDLGRLALSAHRERILGRIRGGTDFGAQDDLPAAPAETEEAADLVAAVAAASNFADGQAARAIYALRRVLRDVAGGLRMRAAWRVGGIETFGGALVHRRDLAAVGEGEVLVSGGSVAAGTGKMSRSAPPFGAPGGSDDPPWEEAGVLERWADLDPTEGGA